MKSKEKKKRNDSTEVVNKEQIQSYIMTTAKYDFNVYEKRILYRLVEMAQCELHGYKFTDKTRRIEPTKFETVNITMPVSSLLKNEDDQNYTRVKKALTSLQKKIFTYEDDKIWRSISIIALPKIEKRSDTISFQVDDRVWKCCLDFSKGYRCYELITAMNFKSVYSMRFYELMSGQNKPITYSLEALKEMFRVQDKYTRVNDFIRYVIEPAKKELDESSPYSFEWEAVKTGRKITALTFSPIFKEEKRDPEVVKAEESRHSALSWDVNEKVIKYLTDSIGFTKIELKNNREVFIEAQKVIPDILSELAILRGKSREKSNPKGWIINALKGKIKDITEDDSKPAAPPIIDFSRITKKV